MSAHPMIIQMARPVAVPNQTLQAVNVSSTSSRKKTLTVLGEKGKATMQTSQQHTCFLSLLYTAGSSSTPRCSFRNPSRIETMILVSNVSRKMMKNTKLEFKESGQMRRENR